jgi:ssDNA-binding Zn-finger/Zn-ribbon topoisomerase 1
MRLVNHTCTECRVDLELYLTTEEFLNGWELPECPVCGAPMVVFNLKNNPQRAKIFD